MKREEGSCILSFPSVGPQGRACPGRGYKKQGPFYSYGPCEGGSRHRVFHWGQREEHLPVWAVTSWRSLLCSLLLSRLEPAGAHLQEACLGWIGSWRCPMQWSSLHPHQAPGLRLVPSHLLGWKLQGQGWPFTLGRTPSATWPAWDSRLGWTVGARATLDMPQLYISESRARHQLLITGGLVFK